MEGKKITLAELAARHEAKTKADHAAQQAWEATPEGKAWRAQHDAFQQRMRDADEQWALDHPQEDEDEDESEEDDEEAP